MNGNGTQESPYEITTFDELNGVKEQEVYYKLMNNIDCHMANDVYIYTRGTPYNTPARYAHIDLNGKFIICPVMNNDEYRGMFTSLHIYNGNILDVYIIKNSTIGQFSYIFGSSVVEDVAISAHMTSLYRTRFGATSSHFNRCNIKISGDGIYDIFTSGISFESCKITFDEYVYGIADNGIVFYNSNYNYICGKIIVNSSEYSSSYGIINIDNGGEQNIVDVSFAYNVSNSRNQLVYGLRRYNVHNKDKITICNYSEYGVTSAELLSPSVLKSKGMQINEVS